MAKRKPLVIVNGIKQQIQAGDYVDPTVLGSGVASADNALRGDGTWSRLPKFTASTAAAIPSSPVAGDTWLCTDNGKLYTYFNDDDSSQWVEFGAEIGAAPPSALILPVVNPSIPKEGDYRIAAGVVEFYVSGAWKQVYPAVYS